MRRWSSALSLAALSVLVPAAFAGSHSPADFPLRVQVMGVNARQHYHNGFAEYVDGDGRADLFENSEPRGFDFAFNDCAQRPRGKPGYETYMARWKKRDRELDVLLPVMGKPGEFQTCALKVDMKDMVYFRRNGMLAEEPSAAYKEWMVKHEYDPEHGKDAPVRLPAPDTWVNLFDLDTWVPQVSILRPGSAPAPPPPRNFPSAPVSDPDKRPSASGFNLLFEVL